MKKFLLKAKKGFTRARKSFFHRQRVFRDYVSGAFALRSAVGKSLGILGMDLSSFAPLGVKHWHHGTSVFVAETTDGRRFFVKKSGDARAVRAEIEAIRFWEGRNTGKPFRTCEVVASSFKGKGGFVVESFLPMKSLADPAFVATMSQTERLALIRRLLDVVRCFHEASFVHSDFTPKNIFVDGSVIVVTDFEFCFCPKGNIGKVNIPRSLITEIGSSCAMGNGIADDAFSLLQMAKILLPDFLRIDRGLWEEINLMVGRVQYDLLHHRLMGRAVGGSGE
jgi:hypothetical protein